MNHQNAAILLDETFDNSYDSGRFSNFIRELFNGFDFSYNTVKNIKKEYKQYIDSYQNLGSYTDSNKKIIDVLVVKLNKESASRDRARTKQRNFVAKHLAENNKHAALVAFYGDDPEDWRFSFVKLDYHLQRDESGKVKPVEELTPAKRYSYLVGVNEPNHTCRSQFLDFVIKEDTKPSIANIEEAFSIDNVTKEFFLKYKELFLKLKESLDEIIEKDPDVKEEFEEKSISTVDFSKKLLGQIVFIYFLQKKGWLGVGKNKETGKFEEWGAGPKKFFGKLFNKEIVPYENFFNDILEPLFYEALAKEHDEDYYRLFDCKIPFLNGGLFEPINDYDRVNVRIPLENSIFESILGTFDRFNFTIKEDEPLDKEVAVDPEMLGKVFENLLDVTDRKSKGAFYTPREIVHYMCQQSLINYLETNTDVPVGDIETFIQHGELAQQITNKADVDEKYLPASIKKNNNKINDLLKNIKIVDPAVGSGAFPMGMMNEIVKVRSILSWLSKEEKRSYYDLKRETIENCLYGVDIDSSAVDITKLRFWLSLVVDESDIKKIKPLPNLDHRIMCGNSLLEDFEGIKLFDERILSEIPKAPTFQLEQTNSTIEKLYQELGEIHTGKRKDNGRKKEIGTELKKLEKRRNAILSKPKDETQQSTFDSVLENRRKKSHKKLAELKRLQKAFFNEQGRKRKRELAEDIERIEWDLVEETLKEQGNEDAMQKLAQYKKNKSKPFFLWKLYFSDVFQRENPGFDVVIANPPYGIVYDSQVKTFYESSFKSFKRNNDIYIAFYEHGCNLLNNEGVLTYITPNTFLNGDYFKDWRLFLTSTTQIKEVIDYKNMPIFADPTVFVSVMLTIKKDIIEFPYEFNIMLAKDSLIKFDLKLIEINKPSEDKLKDKNYVLQKILNLDGVDLIDSLFYVKDVGFNYWTKGGGKTRRGNSIGKRVLYTGKKENDKDISFLKGRDLFKWYFKEPKNYLRFNYDEYLNKSVDTFRFSRNLLEISPKIIYRQTANKIIATLDNNSNLLDKTVHLIVPKNTSDLDLKFILSLLNSKLFNYLYNYISQENTGRAFAQVKTTYIKQLPIKIVVINKQSPFINFVDQILTITSALDYPENPSKQARVKTLENQIDQLVYKLYNLTPEEIEIVEGVQ